MTITRRSLMVLGVLLAVLAASTGVAQAQAPAAPSLASLQSFGYGALRATITPGSGSMPTDTYEIRYEENSVDTTIPGIADVIESAGTRVVYDITGLKHGTRYVVGVRAKRSGQPDSAWSTLVGASTLPARDLDAVQGVQVTAMDKGVMVTWTALTDPTGAPIARYEWQATTTSVGGSNGFVEGTETEAMITGLMNDVEYTVRVRALGSLNGELDSNRTPGAWSTGMKVTPMAGAGDGTDPDPMPTPTPAVPLAGILALFAGLLAAARSRLRRR